MTCFDLKFEEIVDRCTFLYRNFQEKHSAMNSQSTVGAVASEAKPYPLLSDKVRDIIVLVLIVQAGTCISLFGVVANVLNIFVYVRRGMEDSIAIKFLFLSISDFVYSALILIASMSRFVDSVAPNLTVLDAVSFSYSIAQISEKVYFTSVLSTVCISVERCVCIISPFNVRSIFTRTRSMLTVVGTSFMGLAFLIPDFFTSEFVWSYDPKYGSQRLVMRQKPGRENFEVTKDTIISAILPVMAGITTTLTTVLMIAALKSSNTVRNHSASMNNGAEPAKYRSRQFLNRSLSISDVKQAKTVIGINIIFMASCIPEYAILATTVVKHFIPEFSLLDYSGIYRNIVVVINCVAYTTEAFNCALPFVVYYRSSSVFRATFKKIVCTLQEANSLYRQA